MALPHHIGGETGALYLIFGRWDSPFVRGIRPDMPITGGYCWSTPSAENYASPVLSLKAQKSREANAVTSAVSHGNRMTNSIRGVDRQEPSVCARCAAATHCQPWRATGCAAVMASAPVLTSTTRVAARPTSGSERGPHTDCLAPASPPDKTASCAASGQRTPDTRPRHTVGRPHARRPGGDASRPWQ